MQALAAARTRLRRLLAAAHPLAQTDIAAELVLAADQCIITPAGRIEDAARAHAAGDEVRTIIAGYHWFNDWGRDTMISLEGLTLVTGRHTEAGWILRTFARYIHDGLIPNMFPEGEQEGLYHTADATLWFFHAIDRYLEVTQDRATLTLILPKLLDIVEHHLRGTHFGIHVDAHDGLLCQGQEDYQLTWMDAKVGDWVVTPRRGKAVEINALWYNALRLLEGWVREEQGNEAARYLAEHAEQAQTSFNARFWYADGGYLYDVIDGPQGEDAACRPNQVFALSLRSSSPRPGTLGTGPRGRAPASPHPCRAALACPRPCGLQSPRTTATCARAMRRTIRGQYGPGSSGPLSMPGCGCTLRIGLERATFSRGLCRN